MFNHPRTMRITLPLLLSPFALVAPAAASEPPAAPAVALHGYADLHFSYLDHGPDQTRPGGARADDRLEFDTTRLALELEADFGAGVEAEMEIEIEHGGTGAALELEYEEFGEYETEVEAGGEVIVEELYLAKEFGDWLEVKLGRFYVAVGLLSSYYRPTDYLAADRPESESTVLPAVWDEMGVAVELDHAWGELTLQVISGLDSTGFSSQRWVASGHQRRFEQVRATDLAFVGRLDVTALPGLVFGASLYYGDTAGNRPKPDLEDASAPLLIVDGHFALDVSSVRARGVVLWGHLSGADRISEKNSRLSNNLDVLRTPVAREALAAWAEVGADVWSLLGGAIDHRVEPFVRVEFYDTMFAAGANVFDAPRFERTILGAGVGYTFRETVVTKLDWTHRAMGDPALRAEDTVRLAAGFVF